MKHLKYLLTLTVFATQVINAEWMIATNNQCKIDNPYPQPNETATWSGDCVDGYAHGKGKIIWYENGKKSGDYTGDMVQGKAHGTGVATFFNGEKYEGDWKNSQMTGKGIYTDTNNRKYEGEFLNGLRHGWGVQVIDDGLIFEGEYRHNKRAGLGRYIATKGYVPKNRANSVGYWQGDAYIWAGKFYDDEQDGKHETMNKAEYDHALSKLGKQRGQVKGKK